MFPYSLHEIIDIIHGTAIYRVDQTREVAGIDFVCKRCGPNFIFVDTEIDLYYYQRRLDSLWKAAVKQTNDLQQRLVRQRIAEMSPESNAKYMERLFRHHGLNRHLSAVISSATVSRDWRNDIAWIQVQNTIDALHKLASFHRKKFTIPFIGITGSNGKTTTTAMVSSILKQNYKVLETKSENNGLRGTPITLLGLREGHDFAVIEMGTSSVYGIDILSDLVKPSVAIITNINEAHEESIGSKQAILRAKSKILNHLCDQGHAVLNFDDGRLRSLAKKLAVPVLSFGRTLGSDLRIRTSKAVPQGRVFDLEIGSDRKEFVVPAYGSTNVYNACAAIAATSLFGVDDVTVQKGLDQFQAQEGHFSVSKAASGIMLVNDSETLLTPSGFRGALDALDQLAWSTTGRKIAILEITDERTIKRISHLVAESDIAHVFLRGSLSLDFASALETAGVARDRITYFDETYLRQEEKIINALCNIAMPNDVIFVKFSHGSTLYHRILNKRARS